MAPNAIITRATPDDAVIIADIGGRSIVESHNTSPGAEDLGAYVAEKFTVDAVREELRHPQNIFHIIRHDGAVAGYSKMILNSPYPKIASQNVAKLERLYLLKEFYDLKLGYELFQFNVKLAKGAKQAGMYLWTWTGNERAVAFYERNGFTVVDRNEFRISARHSNPNYIMWLPF